MKVDKSKWEVKKLGEVCNILNGYAFKSNLFKEDGERIIRISNINNGFIDIADAVYFNIEDYNVDLSKFVIYKNDILIALSGATTGKIGKYILDNISYLNQRVGLIRSKNNISNSFLYYYMRNKTKESLSLAYGVAQPNLSTKTIQNYVIPVPPLPEQQSIALELDAIQSLITKYKEQLDDYDNLAKSIFNEMFGDVVSNDKGWERKKLKDVTISHSNIKWNNFDNGADFYYVDLSSVNRETKSIENPVKINKNNAPSRAKQIIEKGDILFGTTRPLLKRYCIVGEKFHNQICSTGFCLMRPNKDVVIPLWLLYIVGDEKFYQYLQPLQSGVAYPAVTDAKILGYKFSLPPLPLQQAFATRITAIESQKDQVKQQITDLQTLFDSRMQYYFD